jgi:uncharacterized C2H2 Zn-finger protein
MAVILKAIKVKGEDDESQVKCPHCVGGEQK